MLIEFIGFTSSGKTTLIEKISSDLNKEKIDFNNIELEFLNINYSSNYSKKYSAILLNLKVLYNFFYYSELKNIKPLLKNTNLSFLKKLSYFRNYLKKTAIIKFYKKNNFSKKILLYDEGLLQGYLNIFNHINNDDNRLSLDSFDYIIYPDILIYLKPNTESLIKRIKERNDRKYWKSLSVSELRCYINNFNINVESIIKIYNESKSNKVIKIIDSHNSSKIIYDLIISEIKKEK